MIVTSVSTHRNTLQRPQLFLLSSSSSIWKLFESHETRARLSEDVILPTMKRIAQPITLDLCTCICPAAFHRSCSRILWTSTVIFFFFYFSTTSSSCNFFFFSSDLHSSNGRGARMHRAPADRKKHGHETDRNEKRSKTTSIWIHKYR